MSSTALLFDISPIGGGVGAFIGVAFFLVLAGVAVFAFMMLKKTVKMAVRMIIVAVILLVALVGGIALLMFSSGSGSPRPTPPASKSK
jgi:hypothetical protein